MKTFIALVIIFSFTISFGQEKGIINRQVLFKASTYGYNIYRIPSIVSTSKGTLLAFCSARSGEGRDYDPIDIVMRRSADNGKTWEPMKLLVHNDSLLSDNATPIVDRISGEIHLLYQVDYAKCYYIKSKDEGTGWSEPIDITATVNEFQKVYPWVVLAPGPGHGIQLTNGRLIVPFWLSDGTGNEFGSRHRGHRPSIVTSIFSDDHGKTWQTGEIAIHDNDTTVIPNETSCVQLVDGRVMFNSRNESINYRRLITYSNDGATNWSKPIFADAFFEPICFGSMVRYSMIPEQSKNRILFCNPDSRYDPWVAEKQNTSRSARYRHRTNLTIRMSYDEGNTWTVSKVIDPEIAGYSDIAVTPNGFIHVFYEGGSISENKLHTRSSHVSIVSFNLEWLTDGKDITENN